MSYQALARKWRPQNFNEVIGQEHVVSALTNALSSDRVHHAYLFTGTRGVGKTTLARIFAKALNCEQGVTSSPCGECTACQGICQGNYIDLFEVDAASRTKVEDTRDLLENVQYAPSMGRYKVYLIDEVHMLSTHSFNALLKTLEEPPPHVKFLLATTDPQKLPPTILSRCIQFNLKSMDIRNLQEHMEQILKQEEIPYDLEGLRVIARSADGSVRDGLSLLDQAIVHGDGEVRTERVRVMLGMIDEQFTLDILRAVVDRDGSAVLSTVRDMVNRAVDFRSALDDILTSLHNAALFQVTPDALTWKGIDADVVAEVAGLADAELVQLLYQMALVGKRDFPLATDPRSGFEMTLLRMTVFQPEGTDTHTGGSDATTSAAGTEQESGTAAADPALSSSGPGRNGSGGERQVSGHPGNSAASGEMDIHSPDGWAKFVAGMQITGLTRELAMNLVPDRLADDILDLILDPVSGRLLNEDRVEKIRRQCCDFLGREIRLKVHMDGKKESPALSPAERRDRENKERQAQAEKTFHEDPFVRQMVDRLGMEVVPDSVRPSAE